MDLQAVRHKWRWLHHQGRIGRSRDSSSRAHGQAASRRRGKESERTVGQGLQETRSQPGRCYHDRGVYRELFEGMFGHETTSNRVVDGKYTGRPYRRSHLSL